MNTTQMRTGKHPESAMEKRLARSLMPLVLSMAVLSLAGCMTVGPDYQRPTVNTGITYKEAPGWTQSNPRDNAIKGNWWTIYGDPVLNHLVSQVEISNQNVAQYAAQYREALAAAGAARANLYPSLSLNGSATRSSTNSSSSVSSSGADGHIDSGTTQLEASWELDLWGKLRRTDQEENASAQASAADLANATLSAQSSLVQDYFALRILDQRMALYDQTIRNYQRYVQVTRNLYTGGQKNSADVAQAQATLDSAQSSRLDLQWQRAQYEHAIAILIGKAPSEFSLPVIQNYSVQVPKIPVGIPSTLLQRRPDIAAAERNVASANAAVGVAIAGYYPDLTLSANGGYQATGISKLFSIAHRFWSLGPSLTESIFSGGATQQAVAKARATYDAQVANYRQTVLTALGDVEDNLVQLNTLQDEITTAANAAQNYEESARVTYNQYLAGMINYLDVATTQASSISQQQNVLQLKSEQLTASAKLIAALGGGWNASQIDQD